MHLDRRRSSASSRLSDAFTTGSSIMPQKRNPDAAELVRAKAGRVLGALTALTRGDEGPAAGLFEGHAGGQGRRLFEAFDALELALAAMTGMVADLDAERASAWPPPPARGFSTATDLADWLVRELDLPFREAHHVTGRAVKRAEALGVGSGRPAAGRAAGLEPRDHRGRL